MSSFANYFLGHTRPAEECLLKQPPPPRIEWNVEALKAKYPDRRPPLPRQTVDRWGLSLPPRFYEYITKVSDTIYVMKPTTIQPPQTGTSSFILYNNHPHYVDRLDLASGDVFTRIWCEGSDSYDYSHEDDSQDDYSDDDSQDNDSNNNNNSDPYENNVGSFEKYIMGPLQSPEPTFMECGCPDCFRTSAIHYNVIRIMAGMPTPLNYTN